MMNKVKAELIRRFKENNFNEIKLTMKYDNAVVVITPCTMGCVPMNKIEDVEYFLMKCTTINTYGSENLDDVVDFLVNYENEVKENEEQIEKCRKYWEEHVRYSTDKYMDDFYSDWHKDLFGYRPRRRDKFPA